MHVAFVLQASFPPLFLSSSLTALLLFVTSLLYLQRLHICPQQPPVQCASFLCTLPHEAQQLLSDSDNDNDDTNNDDNTFAQHK
jgi:hypothetical protein